MTQNSPTVDQPPTAPEAQAPPASQDGPPRPAPQRLVRSRTDRKLAGVAGGLGQYAGIDPLIFRIVVVVLTIFGGSGLLLYGLGWLFIPEEGQPESEAQRLVRGRGTLRVVAAGALAVVGLLLFQDTLGGGPSDPGGIIAVAVIGLAAFLVLRTDRNSAVPTPETAPGAVPPPVGAPVAAGAYGQTPGTAYAENVTAPLPPYYGPPPPPPQGAWTPPPPPRPTRERSMLGRLTFSAVLMVMGVLLALRAANADAVPVVVIPAAGLLTVGVGLLIGTVYGRSRWLILLGVVLALATTVTAIAASVPDNGIGVREWTPASASVVQPAYELGLGEATLDLRKISPSLGDRVVVRAEVGLGDLRVMLPDDVTVDVTGRAVAGAVWMPDGRGREGVNAGAQHYGVAGSGNLGTIELDLRVGVGSVWVQR